MKVVDSKYYVDNEKHVDHADPSPTITYEEVELGNNTAGIYEEEEEHNNNGLITYEDNYEADLCLRCDKEIEGISVAELVENLDRIYD